MENNSLLQKVAKDLEQHENSLRIKKVIVCACIKVWENDKNKLEFFRFEDLIKQIRSKNPSLESLKISLYNVVRTLNKPQEYALIAKTIYSTLMPLYPEAQRSASVTSGKSASLNSERNTVGSSQKNIEQKPQSKPQPGFNSNQIKASVDSFALKMEIMNYANPLRAKIVLFSTLYHPFDFTNQDWINLKGYELDDLLIKVFSVWSNFPDFEYHIMNASMNMQQSDENTKVANVIVRCLKPLYKTLEVSLNQNMANNDPVTLANFNQINSNNSKSVVFDEEENTCQFLPSE
ncbi:MAG: hypothetical protein WBB28_19900 [Crinalium sp.]